MIDRTKWGWWNERWREFRLEEHGIVDIDDWCSDPPVQLDAWILPEGKRCYFHARSGGASLTIYQGPTERGTPIAQVPRNEEWEGQADYVERECSYDYDIAALSTIFMNLLTAWRDGVPSGSLK